MTRNVFERLESDVRSYCRVFPKVFSKGQNAWLFDESGESHIDLLAGAGTLGYGHNNPAIKAAVMAYLADDGIVHSLDLYTTAKRRFLESFSEVILAPRGLDYKVQFTGPTGTNAVEAAVKLARKVTGRSEIAAFTRGFHGMTLGSLAATANASKRRGAGKSLSDVTRLPYEGYFGDGIDTMALISQLYHDPSSGLDKPAAFLVETVQGEGGLAAVSASWLQRLAALAKELGALLIVDDIQAGCGRTGSFFSFEPLGVTPDMVCLSKALGGIGLPIAIVLVKPELDRWQPGEHNGTFRGHNLAFVAATAALEYWRDPSFAAEIKAKSEFAEARLKDMIGRLLPGAARLRGRGLLLGIEFKAAELGPEVSSAAFEHGVIAETCGPRDEVLKLLPPLTIEQGVLAEGLNRIEVALSEVIERKAEELKLSA